MLRPWTNRLVCILCILALSVSMLAVPALAGPAMKGEAVRETPLGEEAAAAFADPCLDDGCLEAAGRMPDRPADQDLAEAQAVQAVLMASTEVTPADYTQNFTASGTASKFYTISGNLAANKGTVSYAGLTLTQCLKLESATTVTFNAPAAGTLTLVFVEAAPTIKLDGTKHTGTGQVMTLEVSAGSHTLSKGDTANLFYLVYATGSGNSSGNGHTCVWGPYTQTVAPTCSKVGKETAHCTVTGCDKTNTRDVAKLAHSFKDGVCTVCGARNGAVVGGWFESFYAEMAGVSASEITGVSWSGTASGSLSGDDLKYLVRNATLSDGSTTGVRIDVPGVKAGTYTVTISKGSDKFVSKDIKVMSYDRSGYAHYKYTSGVGAYKDDGTLKSNAVVLYVNESNKNSVKLTVGSTTVTGIGNILNSAGKSQNGNKDILKLLANANTPLVVRIVGPVKNRDSVSSSDNRINGLTAWGSTDFGGGTDDNGGMARMQGAYNVTIEGIGTDATIDGWGFHFIRSSSDKGTNRGTSFELRNLTFRNVPEDCVGMEGTGDAMETPVERCWVHNCSFYAPSGLKDASSDQDKGGGDGACDFKRGQYHTMSYCYYEGYHKTNLIGSSDSVEQYNITWHHNYYKNCESRGPLARKANIHIYNTIYDGQTSYCQNPRANAYIFSEYNIFTNNAKNPGTLKSGGVIKSFNDWFESVKGTQAATVVKTKTTTVTTANKYANFDTSASLSYIPDSNYILDTTKEAVREKVGAYCGVMKAAAALEDVPTETEPTPTVHTHVWSAWSVTTPATCTAPGVESRTCSAAGCTVKTQTQPIPATGHSWGGWKVTVDPTCITAGTEERQCATCQTKESRTVAATGEHSFENGVCTVPGCGVKDPNYDSGGGGSTSGAGYRHSFTASDINSDFYTFTGNTATDKGTVTYADQTLTKCLKLETGTTVTFTAPAAGTLTLVFVEAAPTIKLDGTKHTGTGQVMTLDVSAGAHTLTKANTANLFYLAYESSGSGGTGGGGGEEHTCSDFETVNVSAATCTKTGYTGDQVCTECGKVKTKGTVIPARGHTWSGSACSVCGAAKPTAGTGQITRSGGWFETAYAQWPYLSGMSSYNVYCKKSSASSWGAKVDDELIRQYPTYMRVDIPGLAAGQYDIKVVPCSGGSEVDASAMTATGLTVRANDRSGFAFETGGSPGAYKPDGTLKTGAVVLYLTNDNKDTITLDVDVNGKGLETCTGIQNIILGFKKRKDTRPLCIRVIGNITDPAVLTKGDLYIDSAGNGITIEGIGTDATINGFGIVMKGATNVEVRNLGFMNCDSSEGDSLGLQQANDHVWTHNNDFFYGHAGSDSDQVKGDGSLDTKKSTYVTHSYNHFWDSGKTHLQGMKDEVTENYITYHHNWYDHSDSRHPRVRTCTVHVYNNYFDGNSKYGVGATMEANIFVEKNYFRSTATLKPMLISMQGTDIATGLGTFSKENGGMIKSFDNIMVGKTIKYAPYSAANPVEFDAYEAKSRNEQVPSAITTKQGGKPYSNFDTSSLMYAYTPDAPANVPAEVEGWAGRMEGGDLQWQFTDADDGEYLVIDALKAELTGYQTKLVKVGSAVNNTSGSAPAECAHENTRWTTLQAATCTTDGEQARVCSVCGKTVETKTLPAAGHNPRWVVTTPPTCAQAGEETSTCSVCQDTFGTRVAPATGLHSYGSDDICDECGAAKPTGGGSDPTPPTPTGTVYVLDAKADVYNKLTSNGVDKNNKPIYSYDADGTRKAGTGDFFTLHYTAATKIDYSAKTFDDDYTSDYRINFGGAAAVEENAVAFSTDGDATVEVWWVQAGQDGSREIIILDANGQRVDVTMGDDYVKNNPYYSVLNVPAGGPYYLGGTPANNYIFKVQVTVSDAAAPTPDPVDKAALDSAIATAQTTRTTAKVCNEGGSDVPPEQYWVTQEVMDALVNAIATAQTVAGDDTATQDQVDAAVTALNTAVTAFESAKRPGTLQPEPEPDGDKIFLLDITDAETQTSGSVDGHVYVGGYYAVKGAGTTAGGGDFLLTAKGMDKGWIEFEITGTKAVIEVWASSTKATDNKSPLGLWDPAEALVTGSPDITFVTGSAEPVNPSVTYTVTTSGVYRLGSPVDPSNNRGVRIYQVRITETGSTFCDHDSAFDLLDATPVSCTVDGKSSDIQCRKCGQIVESGTIIPRAGHTFNAAGKCTECGIDRPASLKLVFDGTEAASYDGYVISHLDTTDANGFQLTYDSSKLTKHLKLDGTTVTFRAPDAGTATLFLADADAMNGMTVTVNGEGYTVADNKVSFKTSANTNYVLDRTEAEQPRIFAVEWQPDTMLDSLDANVDDLHWSYTEEDGVITSVKITDPERIDPGHGVYVACWKGDEFLDVKLINWIYDEVTMPEGCTGFKLIWVDDHQIPQSVNAKVNKD